jgi:hypothetical protein
MKDKHRFFKLPRPKIVEFNFILAGYDGMGIVRTIDRARGLIEVLLSPFYEEEFNRLINSISADFGLVEIEDPECGRSIKDLPEDF